ncbi:MAG: DUF1345 domain-containing protein [Pseudomonadota bacterium]|nr:DUF1345 domain-containing protein [Pseudomonadota bacterium]
MKAIAHPLRAHPRLLIAAAVGVATAFIPPDVATVVTRGLLGWNAAVWTYLVTISLMMWRADKGHLQRVAAIQAEGAIAVLTLVTASAIVSFGAVVLELAAAKETGGTPQFSHLLLVAATVVGSWLLVPTLFGLSYASLYFGKQPGKGLLFPSTEKAFQPDYADFLYFSFTIAVASQTSDVSISTREMRRLALLQSILSFVFNTTVLAFSINIAASLF